MQPSHVAPGEGVLRRIKQRGKSKVHAGDAGVKTKSQ
jgi:hypothetical protein